MQPNDEFNPYSAPPASLDVSDARPLFDDEEFSPFKTIWLHPRRTVRQIVASDPELYVVPLITLAGIGQTLDRASMRNTGDELSLATILILAVCLGPLMGLFGLWLGSHLIRISGEWMGGTAPREHIKTAMAWSSVPVVFALPLWIPQLALFGKDMFTEEMPTLDAQPSLLVPLLAMVLIEVTLGIWSIFLICNTVAEVQGYQSAWKGLGNLLLGGLILIGPLILIIMFMVILFASAA